MATVELLLSPVAAHVRTARLVGVAAARRAGLDDDDVADLRLALGEACGRAVRLHAVHAPETPVRLRVTDHVGELTVEVTDAGPPARPVSAAGFGDDLDDLEDGDPQVALTVLAGLVEGLQITPHERGTTVAFTWSIPSKRP